MYQKVIYLHSSDYTPLHVHYEFQHNLADAAHDKKRQIGRRNRIDIYGFAYSIINWNDALGSINWWINTGTRWRIQPFESEYVSKWCAIAQRSSNIIECKGWSEKRKWFSFEVSLFSLTLLDCLLWAQRLDERCGEFPFWLHYMGREICVYHWSSDGRSLELSMKWICVFDFLQTSSNRILPTCDMMIWRERWR